MSRGRGSSRTRRAGAMPGWVEETMAVITNPSPALEVALAYFDAWTHQDFDRAMTYIAENILCDAPAGHVRGCWRLPGLDGAVHADPHQRDDHRRLRQRPHRDAHVRHKPSRCDPCPALSVSPSKNGKTTRSWFVVTGPVRGAETLAHTPPGRAHTPCRITSPRWLDDGDAVESPAADSASVCGRRACDQRVGAGRLRATR